MDKMLETMISNLHKNTGKTLEEWVVIANKQGFEKHGQIIKYLKETHDITHGFANLIAHKAREDQSSQSETNDDAVANQYIGKEHLKPIYDLLLKEISKFGKDIEIAPKKAYVSLRRKKQFATLNPATKSRFEIGINLKGQEPNNILLAEKPNAMCSHKIQISDIKEINKDIISWVKKAYDNAG